jgi:hypothetical protein
MKVSQLQVGDVITHVNGMPMNDFDERVIEVRPASGRDVARAQVEFIGPNPAGIERWLYEDQHEVEVARVLPAEAFVLISDSLLTMIERIEENGGVAPRCRAVLKTFHRFSSPSTDTEIIVRPKRS